MRFFRSNIYFLDYLKREREQREERHLDYLKLILQLALLRGIT